MNETIERFLERPTSHKVIFWLLSVGAVVFVCWHFFYGARAEEAAKLRETVETLKSQIITERRIARNLPKVKEEVKALNEKLNVAVQELPDRKQIPELLSSISDLAKEAGLEVSLFKPADENMRDFYAEVPVSIAVSGSYHQVATFFDEVGQLPRIVNIADIALKEPELGDTKVTISSSCTATTFRYLDEEERKKVAEANQEKADQNKRRKKPGK